MRKNWIKALGLFGIGCSVFLAGMGAQRVVAEQPVIIWLNGRQVVTDTAPVIVNNRTMVPIRAISEAMNLDVEWVEATREVIITGELPGEEKPEAVEPADETPPVPVAEEEPVREEPQKLSEWTESTDASGWTTVSRGGSTPRENVLEEVKTVVEEEIEKELEEIETEVKESVRLFPVLPFLDANRPQAIQGVSIANAKELQALAWAHNPNAPDLAQLYLDFGELYGIRGDVAFCQAAKETKWWLFGNEVKAYQNNYCGLGAVGSPATGQEDLNGADGSRVWFTAGVNGAIFATPADGVEAHIQHLYAYCCKDPLPARRTVLDPRFKLVNRGIAPNWQDLNGRWAVPGNGYGQSIFENYYAEVFDGIS